MAEISQLQVETALKEVIDPYLEQDLVTAKAVKGIVVDGDTVSVDIVLGYPAKGCSCRTASSAANAHAATPPINTGIPARPAARPMHRPISSIRSRP